MTVACMLGWKVVPHNDLPIQKGIWDVDKVDLRDNLDHVRLIFLFVWNSTLLWKFWKVLLQIQWFFLLKLSKSEKTKFKIMSMV
jgi:hypothetical protein